MFEKLLYNLCAIVVTVAFLLGTIAFFIDGWGGQNFIVDDSGPNEVERAYEQGQEDARDIYRYRVRDLNAQVRIYRQELRHGSPR